MAVADSLREQLEKQSKDIKERVDNSKFGIGLLAAILTVILVTGILVVFAEIVLQGMWGWTEERTDNAMVWTLVVLCLPAIFGPLIGVPDMISGSIRRKRMHVRKRLKENDALGIILEDAHWEPVFARMKRYPWMRWHGWPPKTIVQRIELAADGWPIIEALIDRREDRLAGALLYTSFGQYNDVIARLMLGSCLTLGCVVFGGLIIVIPLMPVWIFILVRYYRHQAVKGALLDYILEKTHDKRPD